MRIPMKTACWSLGFLLSTSSVLYAQAKSPQEMQKSCRNFAQGFYDWYVRQLNSGGDYVTALKYKRSAFSPELYLLLKAANEHDVKTGDYFLDFDPILGGQDWPKRVVAGKATIKGDRCWVNKAELMFKGERWFFVNFHYGKDPKYPMNENLLSILKYDFRNQRKNPK